MSKLWLLFVSLFTQLARRIRPTIILIPVTTRLYRFCDQAFFFAMEPEVDHMLKIRGKIQALLDLVFDEFYRNDGPSLDRQKRVSHRSETFWGNGISQVLIGQKKNIVQLCSLDTALSGCHENESILPQSYFI